MEQGFVMLERLSSMCPRITKLFWRHAEEDSSVDSWILSSPRQYYLVFSSPHSVRSYEISARFHEILLEISANACAASLLVAEVPGWAGLPWGPPSPHFMAEPGLVSITTTPPCLTLLPSITPLWPNPPCTGGWVFAGEKLLYSWELPVQFRTLVVLSSGFCLPVHGGSRAHVSNVPPSHTARVSLENWAVWGSGWLWRWELSVWF